MPPRADAPDADFFHSRPRRRWLAAGCDLRRRSSFCVERFSVFASVHKRQSYFGDERKSLLMSQASPPDAGERAIKTFPIKNHVICDHYDIKDGSLFSQVKLKSQEADHNLGVPSHLEG